MQDEHLDVIYINEEVDREEWHTFEVGRTRFNDEALRRTGWFLQHWLTMQLLMKTFTQLKWSFTI